MDPVSAGGAQSGSLSGLCRVSNIPCTGDRGARYDEALSESLYARQKAHQKAAEEVEARNLPIQEELGMRRQIEDEGLRKLQMAYRRIGEDFENQVGRQMALGQILSAVSPFACFTYLMTDLCRTGIEAQQAFLQTA